MLIFRRIINMRKDIYKPTSRIIRIIYKILLFVSLFVYFYPEDYVFLPLSTVRFLQLAGICLVISKFNYFINNPTVRLIIKSGLLIFCVGFVATSIFNVQYDFSFATKGIYFLLYLLESFVIIIILKQLYCQWDIKILMQWIILVTAFQAVIAFVFFLSPDSFTAYQSLVIQTEHQEVFNNVLSKYRLVGPGSALKYASAAVHYGVVAWMTLTMYANRRLSGKQSLYFYILIILFTLAGVLSGRTYFILFPLSFLLLYYICNRSIKRTFKQSFKIYLPLIVAFMGIMIYFFSENEEMMRWIFELFINIRESSSFETDSTNVLKEMYFLPDNIYALTFGEGRAINQDGSQYMHTDVGYIRNVYYWGIIGTLIYYLVLIYLGRHSIRLSSDFRIRGFIKVLVIWLFIYHLKDFWPVEYILILITLCLSFQPKRLDESIKNCC